MRREPMIADGDTAVLRLQKRANGRGVRVIIELRDPGTGAAHEAARVELSLFKLEQVARWMAEIAEHCHEDHARIADASSDEPAPDPTASGHS